MTPRIEEFPHGDYHQFVVRGRPFFPLAAELNNSSLSSSEYMAGVWSRLKDQGFNTLLGSVTWEQIEPTEGVFDFTELDRVVEDAKRHDMHLVLLWFGSFKNGKPVSLSDSLTSQS
jgi:beta-galactosidase GanA